MTSVRKSIVEAMASGPAAHLLTDDEKAEAAGHKVDRASLIRLSDEERRQLPSLSEASLTPGEMNQLKALREYGEVFARTGKWDRMPEGSLEKVLEKCTDRVRQYVALNRKLADNVEETGGRVHLYDEKRDIDDHIDPVSKAIKDRVSFEETVVGLNDKLGTPKAVEQLNSQPVSLREVVSASADHHGEQQ